MPTLDRRELLSGALAGAVVAGLPAVAISQKAASGGSPPGAIDVNVSLFQWPCRRLPLDQTGRLVEKLRSLDIRQAWAGSFEGLLHRDVAGVNVRLAEACREHGDLLVAFGSINPALPDWEEDLRRCHEEHRMPGVRLHPNYHGYSLDDPRFERLLRLAAERRLFVQIATAMEDRRTQHPLLRVADVDLAPLSRAMQRIPDARVAILNHKGTGAAFEQLLKTPGVYADISRVEATDGVARLVRKTPAGRILFGTHAPFLIPEAAAIKVCESKLPDSEAAALLYENAHRLIHDRAS